MQDGSSMICDLAIIGLSSVARTLPDLVFRPGSGPTCPPGWPRCAGFDGAARLFSRSPNFKKALDGLPDSKLSRGMSYLVVSGDAAAGRVTSGLARSRRMSVTSRGIVIMQSWPVGSARTRALRSSVGGYVRDIVI